MRLWGCSSLLQTKFLASGLKENLQGNMRGKQTPSVDDRAADNIRMSKIFARIWHIPFFVRFWSVFPCSVRHYIIHILIKLIKFLKLWADKIPVTFSQCSLHVYWIICYCCFCIKSADTANKSLQLYSVPTVYLAMLTAPTKVLVVLICTASHKLIFSLLYLLRDKNFKN